jgi:hypothetical protein
MDREKRREYQKHYRETHKKERREYEERNRERLAALKRLDYQLNREKYKKKNREWYQKNKHRIKMAYTLGVPVSQIDREVTPTEQEEYSVTNLDGLNETIRVTNSTDN